MRLILFKDDISLMLILGSFSIKKTSCFEEVSFEIRVVYLIFCEKMSVRERFLFNTVKYHTGANF